MDFLVTEKRAVATDVVGDNPMTMKEIIDNLQYIADSPSQEHGGFHPQTVKVAKAAKQFIVNQYNELMHWIDKYNELEDKRV